MSPDATALTAHAMRGQEANVGMYRPQTYCTFERRVKQVVYGKQSCIIWNPTRGSWVAYAKGKKVGVAVYLDYARFLVRDALEQNDHV